MAKAVVFFAEGTEECEALLVVDLLRRAKVEVLVVAMRLPVLSTILPRAAVTVNL